MSGTAGRERRIARLEKDRGSQAEPLIVWCAAEESPEAAIARRFPEGVPENAELLFISWMAGGGYDNRRNQA
jgi:hypothetical protein